MRLPRLVKTLATAVIIMSNPPGTGCASASAPEWTESARPARYLAKDQVEQARATIDALPGDVKVRIHGVLDEMAAVEPTVEGIERARAIFARERPTFDQPELDIGGTPPHIAAFQGGAVCVLQGLVVRASAAVRERPDAAAGATELVREVKSITELGGTAQYKLNEEVRYALGDLYVEALRALQPTAR